MSCATRAGANQAWTMVELRGGSVTGALDNPSSNSLHYSILTVLDSVFTACVAAPAVVGYWRGTWGLSDVYIYPKDRVASSITSIIIGFCGLFTFNVTQNFLDAIFHPDKHRLCYYVGSRLYTAVFGFCCVNAWRGAWQALNILTEEALYTNLAATGVSFVVLVVLRAIRNISAPPFALSVDSCPGYFEVPTMFGVNSTSDWLLYILDCAFSVGVVGTLIVFVWRGVWVFCDMYVFPDNAEYSAVGSLVIGYAVVGITYSIQPIIRYACARLKGLPLLVVADVFLLISFLGTVNVWRGIWNALDVWLLPGHLELSCWISHVGCFVFLVLLNCSNSILVRGVYIDAKEDSGKCVLFPCHYLRLFFKVERERNETRRQNTVGASRDMASLMDTNGKEAENGALFTPNDATRLPSIPESLV